MTQLSDNEWKGHIALVKFDMRAAEKGMIVSVPQIPCRYDRIVDIDGRFVRVQVKYAGQKLSHATGVVASRIKLQVDRSGTMRGYMASEIDAIVLYVPMVDKLCWLEPEDFVNRTELTIRYEKSKNGQTAKINWIEDYEW